MPEHTPQLIQLQLPFKEIPYGYCKCGCGTKVGISDENNRKRGYIKGEPVHFAPGHHACLSPIERFWNSVDKRGPNECWLWVGTVTGRGYGELGLSHPVKKVRAHRFSYELHYGPIPDGILVCHACDVRNCVNPAHLWLGTYRDNAIDREQKGRRKTLKGSDIYAAKLTEDKIRGIRQRYAQGEKQDVLAHEFGVIQQTISNIICRKSWRHVE